MPLINASDSLLLVIDAQDGFYPADREDVDHDEKEQRLRVAAWMCGVARVAGVPVVVTEEDVSTNGPTFAQIAERLPAGTPVLPKRVFGATDNSSIWQVIQERGSSTIVLVGMETDVCVAHSALGVKARGLRPVVVHDAAFSAGSAHRHGLDRLRQEGVELLSAKEVFYDWMRNLASVKSFDERHPDLANPPGFVL